MYADTDFEAEYQKKVEQDFSNSPVVQFVQRLRNYALHTSLPVTTTKLNIRRTGPNYNQVSVSGSIALNVEELRGWDGWNLRSWEYINTLGKEVEIIAMVEQYREVVASFYHWLTERQQEFHQEEFREYERLDERLRSVKQEWEKVWGVNDPEKGDPA